MQPALRVLITTKFYLIQMNTFVENAKADITIIPLILANLVPLAGILFFGWSTFYVLIFYWLESLAVGFFNVLKMALAKNQFSAHTTLIQQPDLIGKDQYKVLEYLAPFGIVWKIFMIVFFILHYSGFMLGHLIFIVFLSAPTSGLELDLPSIITVILNIIVASVAVFASHGISFATNYLGRKEYEQADIGKLFSAPYSRIIVMHITIIGGAFLVSITGLPSSLIIIFIALKAGVDIDAHLKEHRKYQA